MTSASFDPDRGPAPRGSNGSTRDSGDGEQSLGQLIARVAREGLELVSVELVRARAELDERTHIAVRSLWRAGFMMLCLTIGLQALSVAVIVWSASIFGGYITGSLVVAAVFLAFAGAGFWSVKRAAMRVVKRRPKAELGVEERQALGEGERRLPATTERDGEETRS